MKLKSINTILSHPLAGKNKVATLSRFFKRGLVNRFDGNKRIYPFVEDSLLLVSKGSTSAELQIYTGLYDLEEAMLLLHFLTPDDTFVDVGANIGIYTILASRINNAKTICFEPVPITYQSLMDNLQLNKIEDIVRACNIGIGSQPGIIRFTEGLDCVNHVATEEDVNLPTIEISVDTLDNVLADEDPSMLKVDVEGFETEVIKGGSKTLEKESLKIIVIELNGLANRYGFDEEQIHQQILSAGFKPYKYDVFKREFTLQPIRDAKNTIYVRDLNFVQHRVKAARKFKVLNFEL